MPQDQIEEVRNKVDIIELISEYLPLKKSGRNFKALCPFHSEKTPSFMVSPERQIYKCFGCGEGGNVFSFLMKMEGMEFSEALRTLAKRAGVKLMAYRPGPNEREKRLIYEINHLAGEFFHYVLMNHLVGKKALDYVLQRGINRQSLELFKLGFAPESWEGLQQYLVGKKGYRAQDLEKAGLTIKSTGRGYYDRFRGRLMFPLKDHRGNICGFAGRVLEPEAKQAKYVNTPETLVYRKSELLFGWTEARQAIKRINQVVVVEGELDMISSYQAGVRQAVAIKGSALTEPHVRLIKRLTENLVLALDQDVAGDAAARRGIEVAEAAGLSIRVVAVKGGKDPDEVAQKDPAHWREQVEGAIPIYDYFLSSALTRFDPQTAEGKRQIGRELVPVLAGISDEIVRSHYLILLSEKLGVDQTAIVQEIDKVAGKVKPDLGLAKAIDSEKKSQMSLRERLEEYLLAIAFQSGQWPLLKKRGVKAAVVTPRYQGILEILADYFKKYKTYQSERLAKMLPAELKESYDQLYLIDLSDLLVDDEMVSQEFQKALNRLQKLVLKARLKALVDEVKMIENQEKLPSQEKKRLKDLDEEFKQLSEKLAQFDTTG